MRLHVIVAKKDQKSSTFAVLDCAYTRPIISIAIRLGNSHNLLYRKSKVILLVVISAVIPILLHLTTLLNCVSFFPDFIRFLFMKLCSMVN